ncbi:hypothetical protein K457DRAFT_1761461, partial [Linnemannia elongata AG-77]
MYSFKFRKSGLRTQVCIDVNNMVVFMSKIHGVDCIGLDGGYPQHIPKLLEK